MANEIHHPSGLIVDILGTEAANNGRSCEEHEVCGVMLDLDAVVRLRRVQIVDDDGDEETAIAAYWVTDGVDRCRVGFLGSHCINHWQLYHGKLAQVVDIFSGDDDSPTKRKAYRRNKGCCRAVIIDTEKEDDEEQKQEFVSDNRSSKKQKTL